LPSGLDSIAGRAGTYSFLFPQLRFLCGTKKPLFPPSTQRGGTISRPVVVGVPFRCPPLFAFFLHPHCDLSRFSSSSWSAPPSPGCFFSFDAQLPLLPGFVWGVPDPPRKNKPPFFCCALNWVVSPPFPALPLAPFSSTNESSFFFSILHSFSVLNVVFLHLTHPFQ